MPMATLQWWFGFVLITSSLLFARGSPQAQPRSRRSIRPRRYKALSRARCRKNRRNSPARVHRRKGRACGIREASGCPERSERLCLEPAEDGRRGRQDRHSRQRHTCSGPRPEECARPADGGKGDQGRQARGAFRGSNGAGGMQAWSSIPKLKDALADDEPIVVLAAAHALDLMHDDSALRCTTKS